MRSWGRQPRGRQLLVESILFGIAALTLLWFYPYGLRWEVGAVIFLAGCKVSEWIVRRIVDAAKEHPRTARHFVKPS
jgi:hypothetical protein